MPAVYDQPILRKSMPPAAFTEAPAPTRQQLITASSILTNPVAHTSAYSNYLVFGASLTAFANCCFAPALTSSVAVSLSTNHITDDPQFADPLSGNYRVSPYSPCLNTGATQRWMTNAVDLDGGRRIRYGIVDMGAYERFNQGAVYSVR